ncbi:MAG: helix-turn-helix domain-containing protein [Eubacteriales bacterium]|nr:helix-turn-helix domain-containing protein [Eubacteriales bacterium]
MAEKIYAFILSAVHQDLAFISNKEKLLSLIKNNLGLEAILKTAYAHLNNPIFICSMTLHVHAKYSPGFTPKNLRSKEGIEYFEADYKILREQNFFERITSSRVPFIFPEKIMGETLLQAPMHTQNSVLGYVCVSQVNRPFDENDVEYVAMLSDIICLELQKNSSISSYSIESRDHFLIDLINGNLDDPEMLELRSSMIHFKISSHNWLMLMRLRQKDTDRTIDGTIGFLKRFHTRRLVAKYQDSIVLLSSDSKYELMPQEEFEPFKNYMEERNFVCAISSCFHDISHAPDYFQQVQELLKLHEGQKMTEPIINAADCLDQLLLFHNPYSNRLRLLIHPDIKELYSYDQLHHTEYIPTLRAYFENERNAVKTAQALHIHKSTFFFRINKISELIDFSLTDTHKLYYYEFSLKIMDYQFREQQIASESRLS